jgi:hypothetical protein
VWAVTGAGSQGDTHRREVTCLILRVSPREGCPCEEARRKTAGSRLAQRERAGRCFLTEPELVLFYGLTPTEGLLRLHADMERIYRRWSSPIITRTQSGVWVPHCTLATQVDASRVSEAVAAAATLPLPWVATQVRLAMVRFDQGCVELLNVFPRQEYPVRRAGVGFSGVPEALSN